MTQSTRDTIHHWIEEAAGSMGGQATERREALLELESTIYEKIDERTAGGEAEEQATLSVLESLGDPRTLGHAFMPQHPLLRPELTRSFLLWTWGLFAVHFVLVIGATLAGRDLVLPPLRIRPMEHFKMLQLFARTLEVLLFDAGAMLAVFVLWDRIGHRARITFTKRRHTGEPRYHFSNAAFLALVLVVANFLRDNLIALYVKSGTGTLQIPLIGSGFTDNLVLFNAWIALTIVRECLYGRQSGNRRGVLILDITTRALGIFCLLRIVATQRLVDITGAKGMLGTNADTVAALLNTAFSLIALTTAAVIGVELVRRVFRFRS